MNRFTALLHLTSLVALFITHYDIARADPMPGLRRALETLAASEATCLAAADRRYGFTR